jgi:uncharacterized SAM-binding protein YcdF (DUF218 family)
VTDRLVPAAETETPARVRRWRWRDTHAWHGLAVATAALVASGGLLYAYYWVRTARIAHRAPTAPRSARHLLLFGKRLVGGEPDADFTARVARLHALLQADAARDAWLLGGRTGAGRSEAEAAHAGLVALGLPTTASVHLEQASAHTLDNLRHARELIGTRDGTVALITSRYHLARCALLAQGLGLAHELCAAEERLRWNLRTVRALSAEAMLTLWIDIGTRYARLIRHRGMIARVS